MAYRDGKVVGRIAGIICHLYNEKNKNKAINIARVSILALSVLLIVVGIFNGGAEDVLQKAINICTECIGLA